jgi:hypothetical protein
VHTRRCCCMRCVSSALSSSPPLITRQFSNPVCHRCPLRSCCVRARERVCK